jgi:hypothetical protein
MLFFKKNAHFCRFFTVECSPENSETTTEGRKGKYVLSVSSPTYSLQMRLSHPAQVVMKPLYA